MEEMQERPMWTGIGNPVAEPSTNWRREARWLTVAIIAQAVLLSLVKVEARPASVKSPVLLGETFLLVITCSYALFTLARRPYREGLLSLTSLFLATSVTMFLCVAPEVVSRILAGDRYYLFLAAMFESTLFFGSFDTRIKERSYPAYVVVSVICCVIFAGWAFSLMQRFI